MKREEEVGYRLRKVVTEVWVTYSHVEEATYLYFKASGVSAGVLGCLIALSVRTLQAAK